MSTSVRVARWKAEAALRVVGEDAQLREALGLVPYWGVDTARAANRSRATRVLRAPDLVDDEADEASPVDDLQTRFTNVD